MTWQSHAETKTSASTTTGVFALLKAKPGVTRERIMAVMPAEIRATVPTLDRRENPRMVLARRRQGRRFSPEHLGRRRGKIHHGIFAAC